MNTVLTDGKRKQGRPASTLPMKSTRVSTMDLTTSVAPSDESE